MLSQVFFTPPHPTKKKRAGAKGKREFIGTVSYGSCHVSTPLQVSLKSDFVVKDVFDVTLITWQE